MAMYGWNSPKQAALSTRTANQKQLAADAMAMVDPDYTTNKSVPPQETVGSGGTLKGKKSC